MRQQGGDVVEQDSRLREIRHRPDMVLEVHRCLRRRAERPRVEQSAVRCHSLGPCGRLSRSGSPGRRRAMPVSWARTSETASGVATIDDPVARSEEHTSELKSLMRLSYAVFCLKKKNN